MGMLANTQYYCLLKRLVTSSDVGWAGRIGLTASWCANHLVCPEILYPPRIPMVSCAVPCSGGCWTCLWSAYHGIYIYSIYIYIQYIYIYTHIYIYIYIHITPCLDKATSAMTRWPAWMAMGCGASEVSTESTWAMAIGSVFGTFSDDSKW